jgi:glutamate synthase domain-containing protein 3
METINAANIYYQQLNELIRNLVDGGVQEITLDNVNGQRYIGVGLSGTQKININGIPGNNLASLMDGLTIEVFGNGQDGIGNTMNDGTVIVHGNTSDITGYAMRSGKIFVKGNVGYRVGIHMKAYKEKQPLIVVGGKAEDFLGEYMAGGTLVLLGLNLKPGEVIVGDYVGTGMHGGAIYIRGEVPAYHLGKEIKCVELNETDFSFLKNVVTEFAGYFKEDVDKILQSKFIKLISSNKRPYGTMYVY